MITTTYHITLYQPKKILTDDTPKKRKKLQNIISSRPKGAQVHSLEYNETHGKHLLEEKKRKVISSLEFTRLIAYSHGSIRFTTTL